MIDKSCGTYDLICDICGECAAESFDDFYDAVEAKKELGWISRKINGEWNDICPGCRECGNALNKGAQA